MLFADGQLHRHVLNVGDVEVKEKKELLSYWGLHSAVCVGGGWEINKYRKKKQDYFSVKCSKMDQDNAMQRLGRRTTSAGVGGGDQGRPLRGGDRDAESCVTSSSQAPEGGSQAEGAE